jgi:hypothetical protein
LVLGERGTPEISSRYDILLLIWSKLEVPLKTSQGDLPPKN